MSEWASLQADLATAGRQRQSRAHDEAPPVTSSTAPAQATVAAAAPATSAASPPVAAAAPTPQPAPAPSPTVAVQIVGVESDFKRLGLGEADLRAAVTRRLQGAGYQPAENGGLTLALVLKYSYGSTTGIYSYSTTVTARGSGKGGAPVNWSGGETGIAQDRDIRKLNGIFLKHVDAFVAAHPAR
jgi:hypothetical protein